MSAAISGLPEGVVVLERGWLSSNNVVIRGSESAALVDSGYATHAEQTVTLVQTALRGLPLTLLVNTHLHSDHCGGNSALRRAFPDTLICIPPGLATAVRSWDTAALTYSATGQTCPPFTFDRVVTPGECLRLGDLDWEVHAAPGHDPHSVILFEPMSRCLLSADALWENGFGIVFPELEGVAAFDEVARTLDVIERLSPRVIVPGHGAVFHDVPGAVARARSRLDAYVASPARHAGHASKVLLKFKLLEWQRIDLRDYLAWAGTTSYFGMVHERYFADVPLELWIRGLIDDLTRSGAARIEGSIVSN
ncbi:MBL fold metallo-hydrolase [Ramlibacter sp. PS3R-8]|uniref:MBL fold metallo-hydrolase n=1 Tax=Ramlibacter sp. PS3R-8 TaxID=3133437 RepID=UPI00309854ED